MYTKFYRFQRPPFENTPDPRSFYASEQHREALAAIEYVIRMRKGFVLVTGDIGSGKTTVGRTMLERCGKQAQVVGVLHGHDSAVELLRQILIGLGTRFEPADGRAVLLSRLHTRLKASAAQGQSVILYVDEAQTLADQALEELRLLSNFDTETQKLVQVVLIGQPELRRRIGAPHLTALRQRIVLAKQLKPMGPADTKAYISHRLRAASADPADIAVGFAPAAVNEIYTRSNGTPRLINFLCDNCLLVGFVEEAKQITAEMVKRVVADMVPSFDEDQACATRLSLAGNF